MFTSLLQLLPQTPGLLPKWQLLVSVLAIFNSVQNFATIKLTQRLYTESVVTPLQARTSSAWTVTSAVVRMYAAYRIHDKAIYDMTIFTYLIAFAHFSSEILIFRSAKVGMLKPVLSPVIVASTSLVWMFLQYDFYVGKGGTA